MTWFHHRCTHGISDNSRKMSAGMTFLLRRQSCRKKAIWTSAIFLMSRGKVGEQKGPQTSEPYETVGRTKASNKTPHHGKGLLTLRSPLNFARSWAQAHTALWARRCSAYDIVPDSWKIRPRYLKLADCGRTWAPTRQVLAAPERVAISHRNPTLS